MWWAFSLSLYFRDVFVEWVSCFLNIFVDGVSCFLNVFVGNALNVFIATAGKSVQHCFWIFPRWFVDFFLRDVLWRVSTRVMTKKKIFLLLWHWMSFFMRITNLKKFFENFEKRSRTNAIFWPHLPPISTFFLYGAILSQKTFLLIL